MVRKKIGVLDGKFIKQVSPTLYKFQATAQICYITTDRPWKGYSEEPTVIMVKESGELAGLRKYKFLKFTRHAGAFRARVTKKIQAREEKNSLIENNPAFSGGKYVSQAYQNRPDKWSRAGQKNMMLVATEELRKVLRTAPENQEVKKAPRRNYDDKWEKRMPRSANGAAIREKEMMQKLRDDKRAEKDAAEFFKDIK